MIEFILGSIGLTLIITRSKILTPFRSWITKKSLKLGEALSCPMCVGLWSGIVCHLLISYNLDIFIYAFIGSCIGDFYFTIKDKLR